jgi:hypothetical protein
MSSVPPTEPNRQSNSGVWKTIAPYVVPPVAAGAAIVPVFYGLMAKSDQQLGKPIRQMNLATVFKEGCEAAPVIGGQVFVQNVVEKALQKRLNSEHPPSFNTMLASAIIVSFLSVPPLAVLNGLTTRQKEQTFKQCAMESLKLLSPKQALAIVSRETSFLFSLRISEPIALEMKRRFGEHPAVAYGSAFMSGAVGSVVGHPADTALTLWQKGKKVENLRQLMRGGPIKAATVGSFAICYEEAKKFLNSLSE